MSTAQKVKSVGQNVTSVAQRVMFLLLVGERIAMKVVMR
jgi:hypothetical protein